MTGSMPPQTINSVEYIYANLPNLVAGFRQLADHQLRDVIELSMKRLRQIQSNDKPNNMVADWVETGMMMDRVTLATDLLEEMA